MSAMHAEDCASQVILRGKGNSGREVQVGREMRNGVGGEFGEGKLILRMFEGLYGNLLSYRLPTNTCA